MFLFGKKITFLRYPHVSPWTCTAGIKTGYNVNNALIDAELRSKEAVLITGSNNSIRCSKVEISGTNISELHCDGIFVTVPREQIRQIKLSRDTSAKNPFCQYFLGFTLFSIGMIGLIVVFYASMGGVSLLQSESGEFVLPLVPAALWTMVGIGLWLLSGIFRTRYLFLISTENGIQKIFFEKSADVNEIQQFIMRAHLNFGYSIDVSSLQKNHVSS
jgi:hypothetical protein